MTDLSNYNIYTNKDGRTRAYNKLTHKVVSYPRVLMEQILGRPLLKTEDVHHKDENPLNNNPDNLEVIDHVEHTRAHGIKLHFEDKEMICPVCNEVFIWSADRQRKAHRNSKRKDRVSNKPVGPFCSRRCAGTYSQRLQMEYRKNKTNKSD